MAINLQSLAASFLLQIKKEEDTVESIQLLADYPSDLLFTELANDADKKAFWINCYNAFFLQLRRDQGLKKPTIYRAQLVKVAGQAFSLDEIEHGVLRRFRLKLGLGYIPDFFVASHIRQLAVESVDYRIHFALNCGAKSCPPIAFYSADKLDKQLEWATLGFLENETDYIEKRNEIHFTQLGQWYLGDFGGYSGIREIVIEKLNVGDKKSKLIFKPYDWDEKLDNFRA